MLLGFAIKESALKIGFDLAGIAPIGVWKDLEFSRQWVRKGFNGEMRYLENPKRFDPRLVLPSAKSVICVGLVYNAGFRSQESGVRSQETEEKVSGVRCQAPGGECAMEREVKKNYRKLRPRLGPAPSPPPLAPFFFNGQRTTDSGQLSTSSSQFPISAGAAPRAWISRYAWGQDYHEILRAKLEQLRATVEGLAPGVETRVFVDTGPVIERAFARFSGIGWMGKNTCIINQEKGSWLFLGVILASLELAPDLPAPDRCGSCTACLEACPTGALVEPYVMDASRCISYLTVELKGAVPERFRPKISGNVFGCDICQDVCPWNGSRQSSVLSYQQAISQQRQSSEGGYITHPATTKVPQFHPMTVALNPPTPEEGSAPKQLTTGNGRLATDNERRTTDDRLLTTDHGPLTTDTASFSLFNPPLDALALFSEKDFRRTFAHSPIKRAKYRGWLRNLCVAMGNSSDERFVPWLQRAAQHFDPLVREHAAWALDRLRGK
jgi:epoxyqueuosine reductase